MLETQPSKTFRGTWDEILAHQGEIPAGSRLELNVFEPASQTEQKQGAFQGRSIADVMQEIGFVEGLPSDLSERAEEYLANSDFGVTKSLRQIDP